MKTTMIFSLALVTLAGCGKGAGSEDGANSDSEVATSVVSGAMNTGSGTSIGQQVPKPRRSILDRALDTLSPIGTALAASFSCMGDRLSPMFNGPGSYTFTPASCTVKWGNDKSASSTWSSTFDLVYGNGCDDKHASIGNQKMGCDITRTTGADGNTRTITGPDGRTYAVEHNTNGAGTSWDMSTEPTNNGVIASCTASNLVCTAGTLVISGSHLTGTVTGTSGKEKIWDHTVYTGQGGLQITRKPNRTLNGSVTVQHNILKYNATATFNDVSYGDPLCCFPTSGSVTTTFSGGPHMGKTETLTFDGTCASAHLVDGSGASHDLELRHCL
jgi:hypothetical protein